MRPHLSFLLLDGFDPDTGELALRAGYQGPSGPELLRLKLHLGRVGDPLQPLRRELTNLVQMPLPPIWDRGLKLIIRAVEDDLAGAGGRDPRRYRWVQTQILHPTDERRSTLNHPVPRQVEVLWDWAQRLDQAGDSARTMELLERLLLLAPRHELALAWLASLLRGQGMVEELLEVCGQWLRAVPRSPEALLRKGEALLHLERHREALEAFNELLKLQPLHALAHLGAAQAQQRLGLDPFPHLDAALELDREVTRSVLRETFDFRLPAELPGALSYPVEELPTLLGVSLAEIRAFVAEGHLPLVQDGTAVREADLSRWVSIQNRFQLLDQGLHWSAHTPRALPPLAAD